VNPRLPISRDSEAGKLPRQQENEFLGAASKVFRTAFPNSERAGCPSQTALRSVARKECEAGEGERILEHMTCCSVCFGEYEALLRKPLPYEGGDLLLVFNDQDSGHLRSLIWQVGQSALATVDGYC